MNKSKQKSKKSDKGQSQKDENRATETKMNSAVATESPTVTGTTQAPAPVPAPTPGGPPPPSTLGASPPTASRPSPAAWFTTEIQQMMHGFGDCRKPLPETATVIEEIVHQQMATLMYQAVEVASMRNARFLGIEDFLFLLRKDKVKLRRLIKYMTFKDYKGAALKGSSLEEEEQTDTGDSKQPPKKKRKICCDFLTSIDQTGELVALFEDDSIDEVKQERALRAELQTRPMDSQQYMEYCEARQASFTARYKSQKFKDWLMMGVNVDLKPNPLAMEILSYLAYETVAQIVDLSLLVKRDSSSAVEEPFMSAMPAVCVNHEIPLGPQPSKSAAGAAATAAKSPSHATGSPNTTPPSTPTTPSPMAGGNTPLTPASGSGGAGTGSASGGKPKPTKKRKKSGSQISRDLHTSQAIQPSDVREALRRYSQSIGPFADFSKSCMISPKMKVLCC